MGWPVQSADLNPIELVWDELGQKVRAKQPTNVTHLFTIFSLLPIFGGKNAKNLRSNDSAQTKSF